MFIQPCFLLRHVQWRLVIAVPATCSSHRFADKVAARYGPLFSRLNNLSHTPQKAVPVPGDGRDDWKILRALSEVAGTPLAYNDIDGVRARLAEVAPHMGEVKAVEAPLWLNGEYFKVRHSRVAAHHARLRCSLHLWQVSPKPVAVVPCNAVTLQPMAYPQQVKLLLVARELRNPAHDGHRICTP